MEEHAVNVDYTVVTPDIIAGSANGVTWLRVRWTDKILTDGSEQAQRTAYCQMEFFTFVRTETERLVSIIKEQRQLIECLERGEKPQSGNVFRPGTHDWLVTKHGFICRQCGTFAFDKSAVAGAAVICPGPTGAAGHDMKWTHGDISYPGTRGLAGTHGQWKCQKCNDPGGDDKTEIEIERCCPGVIVNQDGHRFTRPGASWICKDCQIEGGIGKQPTNTITPCPVSTKVEGNHGHEWGKIGRRHVCKRCGLDGETGPHSFSTSVCAPQIKKYKIAADRLTAKEARQSLVGKTAVGVGAADDDLMARFTDAAIAKWQDQNILKFKQEMMHGIAKTTPFTLPPGMISQQQQIQQASKSGLIIAHDVEDPPDFRKDLQALAKMQGKLLRAHTPWSSSSIYENDT